MPVQPEARLDLIPPVGWAAVAVDLNAVAAANRDRRRAGCDAACAGDATGRLARFGELAARSSFGTNVQPDKVLAFDELGEVVDAARVGAHRGTPPPVDGFYARRRAFEDHWEHGRRFVYGAPNAGGPGAPFGPILLPVADPEVPAPDALRH